MKTKTLLRLKAADDVTLVVERMSPEAFAEARGMAERDAAAIRQLVGDALLAIWAEADDGTRRYLRVLPDDVAALGLDLWASGVADACAALEATA